MFDLEWKLNGRTVRPNQIENELKKAMTKSAQTQLKKNIESQRCRKHGKAARLISRPNSFKGMKIEGCCQEFTSKLFAQFNNKKAWNKSRLP